MKSFKLVCLLTMGFAVALVATGCKSPQNTKKIHNNRPVIVQDTMTPPIEDPNKVENFPPPHPIPPNVDWKHDPKAFEAQTIYFALDSVVIKGGEKTKAAIVAAFLQSNPGSAVQVEGNCDERGTEEYNRSLGERRALAAREALIAAGIEPQRVTTISYGEDNPADPEHNEAAWQKNRRAAFVLLTPPQ